jgi:poly(3-hydroxyalkanoate) synthetase
VVEWLYRENRIATGKFVALGRAIDLADIRMPIYLLAGRDDTLVAPNQLLAVAHRVGTPKRDIMTAREPCGHLSLYLGRRVLNERWPVIARWLAEDDAARHGVSEAAA